MMDAYCQQPLRATVDSLPIYAPGVRGFVPPGGQAYYKPAKLILKRWPVLAVTAIQIAPANQIPYNFTAVPAGQWAIQNPVAGLYNTVAPGNAGEGGQAVMLQPGILNWQYGHEGWVADVTYINGWPHCGLTEAADATATELQVDDCTGWDLTGAYSGFTGATGVLYDAAGQEVAHVTSASAEQGPGTLTLSSPLQNNHAAGVMLSTLPAAALQAAVWFCCSIALTRGATATTIREVAGTGQSTEPPKGPDELKKLAQCSLDPYRRII
jgi:hypothetical protein